MTAPRVNTTDFEFSHGRKPRGRGSWAFFFERDRRNHDVQDAFWHHGSFTEAKKAAVEEARRRGARDVFVGS